MAKLNKRVLSFVEISDEVRSIFRDILISIEDQFWGDELIDDDDIKLLKNATHDLYWSSKDLLNIEIRCKLRDYITSAVDFVLRCQDRADKILPLNDSIKAKEILIRAIDLINDVNYDIELLEKQSGEKTQAPKYPRIKSQPKSENTQPGQWFPKYILDENRKETEFFTQQEIWRYSWLCNLMPAEVKTKDSCVSLHQIIWAPDDFGKACFKQKVKEILVKSGLYEYEDLKKLTTRQILALMDIQLNRTGNDAFKKYTTQWQNELREAYQIGLNHKDYWQNCVIEAVESAKQWYEDCFIKGKFISKIPLPYMDDYYRNPNLEDLQWMYWVLGMKLEYVFGIDRIFIPEDVRKDMNDLNFYRLIEKSVSSIVYGVTTVEEFKTWWGIIKQDIESSDGENKAGKNQVKTKQNTQSGGDNELVKEVIPENVINLDEDELELLNWFNDQYPSICYVKRYPKRDDRTKYKYAKSLEKKHLLKRPEGKMRGHVITEIGRKYIEKYYS
jgi:hypothetical protein